MSPRHVCLLVLVAGSIAAVGVGAGRMQQPSSGAGGQATPAEKPAEKPAAGKEGGPAAMMAAMGKAIAALKADEGTWDAAVSLWPRPGMEPIKSHATVTAKMDLGGMFLQQRFEGTFGAELGNKAWTSLSYTGFNASTGEYEAVRMASTNPTMFMVRGKAKAGAEGGGDGLSVEMTGEYMLMGARATERDVIRHEGEDKCVIESWMSFGGSPEFKGAEMVLTRAK